jgi:hypothetical protein
MSKALTWPNFKGERRTIPGVPSPKDGWGPGVKLPLSEVGMSEAVAAERIKDTPLQLVDLKDAKTTKGGD